MDLLRRFLIALAAAGLLVVAGWKVNGWRLDAQAQRQVAAQAVAQRDAQAEARRIAQQRAEKLQRINDDKAASIRRIDARLADALGELRSRPERLPGAGDCQAVPSCQGATGAELSGPDAAFLVREAARAERQRAALKACYDDQED